METLSTNLFLETELASILKPSDYLASSDCHEGTVYWLDSRSMGHIGICKRVPTGEVAFEGLREKLGTYFLFSEYHYDDSDTFGTVRPYVELGPAPVFQDKTKLMHWFLDQEVEFVETKIEWLKQMPLKYADCPSYRDTLVDEARRLHALYKLRQEGFEAQQPISLRSIIEHVRANKQT